MKSFPKSQETPVQSVEVDIEYNLTIYLEGRKIKTINIKDLI